MKRRAQIITRYMVHVGDYVLVEGDPMPARIIERYRPRKEWDGSYVVQHWDGEIGWYFPRKFLRIWWP